MPGRSLARGDWKQPLEGCNQGICRGAGTCLSGVHQGASRVFSPAPCPALCPAVSKHLNQHHSRPIVRCVPSFHIRGSPNHALPCQTTSRATNHYTTPRAARTSAAWGQIEGRLVHDTICTFIIVTVLSITKSALEALCTHWLA